MSSFVAGLDEAEAFGDLELMAEFSLLSVVQNLQQGKMATDLLETLEVKHEFKRVFVGQTIFFFLPRLWCTRERLYSFCVFLAKM